MPLTIFMLSFTHMKKLFLPFTILLTLSIGCSQPSLLKSKDPISDTMRAEYLQQLQAVNEIRPIWERENSLLQEKTKPIVDACAGIKKVPGIVDKRIACIDPPKQSGQAPTVAPTVAPSTNKK